MNNMPGAVFHAPSPASAIRSRGHGPLGWAGALAAAVVLAGCAATDTMMPPGADTPTASAPIAVAHNPTPPFSAGVVPTTPPPHRLGDEVGFTMTTNATGFGHLYLLNASGKVVALVENLPVAAGVASGFPSPGSGMKLRASPPAGTERVLFLVTRERFAGFSGGAAASAPRASLADCDRVRDQPERGDGEACKGWLGTGGDAGEGAAGGELRRGRREVEKGAGGAGAKRSCVATALGRPFESLTAARTDSLDVLCIGWSSWDRFASFRRGVWRLHRS